MARRQTLYLSPKGNDRNPGTAERPFATPQRAQRAARKMVGAVQVVVGAGVYELDETLTFTPADNGQRWSAAPGARPVLSGGRLLSGWAMGTHNDLAAWTLDLPEVSEGKWSFTQLWVNGQRRTRPRLPKSGFFRFSGLDGQGDSGYNWNKGPVRAEYPEGSLARFNNLDEVGVVVYQLWFDTHHRIKALNEAKKIVHFHAVSPGSLCDESGQFARFFLTNVGEALSEPGEWYLDKAAGRLTYLPMSGETPESVTVFAPRLTEIVRFQGSQKEAVADVVMENITFAHNEWTRSMTNCGVVQAASDVPGAIVFERAEHCVLYGCELSHCAGYGIEILVGSQANTIAACTVHDLGAGAIKINHESLKVNDAAVGRDFTTAQRWLRPIAATVADCNLHDGGHIYPSAPGVWIGNAGANRIQHNHIHHFAYTGISFGWSWGYAPTRAWDNRIEHNHINHINHQRVLSDNGGIYSLGVQPGSTVIGNHLHDVACYHYGGSGLYPDEGSSGILFQDNCVHDVSHWGLYIHYGRFMTFRNNLFACMRKGMINPGLANKSCGLVFEQNIIWFDRDNLSQLGEWEPQSCRARRNLIWNAGTGGVQWQKGSLAHENAAGRWFDTVEADPLLADPRGGDFSLRDDSPAMGIGFRPFDWRNAGVRRHPRGKRPVSWNAYRLPPAPAKAVAVARIEPGAMTGTDDGTELRVRIILSNPSSKRVNGNWRVKLAGNPAGSLRVEPSAKIAVDLPPRCEAIRDLTVHVGATQGLQWLQAVGDERTCFSAAIPVNVPMRVTMPRLPAGSTERQALAIKIVHGGSAILEGSSVIVGDDLLVKATIHEQAISPNRELPYFGSSLELFAGPEPEVGTQSRPMKLTFIPPDAAGPAEVRRGEGNPPAASTWEIVLVPGGWRVILRLPLSELGVDPVAGRFRFDLICNVASPIPGQNLLKLPIWGSLDNHQNIFSLAKVVVLGKS